MRGTRIVLRVRQDREPHGHVTPAELGAVVRPRVDLLHAEVGLRREHSEHLDGPAIDRQRPADDRGIRRIIVPSACSSGGQDEVDPA